MAGILIVDDDPTIRGMFTRALKALGDIDQAANGGEALRLLGAKKYDIVLLDLHMPIIDGFVLLHTLANKPGLNRETPIYVITADTSEQARVRALKRRAVFMLTKPVPIATLTALVESALRKAAVRAAKPPGAAAEEEDDDPLDVDPQLLAAVTTAPKSASPGRATPPVRPGEPSPPRPPAPAKKPGS